MGGHITAIVVGVIIAGLGMTGLADPYAGPLPMFVVGVGLLVAQIGTVALAVHWALSSHAKNAAVAASIPPASARATPPSEGGRPANMEPGWQQDPENAALMRWWTGAEWGPSTRPK